MLLPHRRHPATKRAFELLLEGPQEYQKLLEEMGPYYDAQRAKEFYVKSLRSGRGKNLGVKQRAPWSHRIVELVRQKPQTYTSVLHGASGLVPPGRALRRREKELERFRRRPTKTGPSGELVVERSNEEKVMYGQRMLVRDSIQGLTHTKTLETYTDKTTGERMVRLGEYGRHPERRLMQKTDEEMIALGQRFLAGRTITGMRRDGRINVYEKNGTKMIALTKETREEEEAHAQDK